MLRPLSILLLAAAAVTGPALAQSPAERASRRLEQGVEADRLRDAARDARGDPRPTRPEVQQFEPERRTLQPDVGRPEETGTGGTLTDGTRNATGMGPNPQR
jgi:hypothetical protein